MFVEWRVIEKRSNGVRYRKFVNGKPTNSYKLELVGGDPTLDLDVGAQSDDAFEYLTGLVNIVAIYYNIDSFGEHAGFRWTGVNIPSGATIGTAYMSVYVSTYDDPRVYIYCQDANNPPTFVAENNNITNRPKTTKKATWSADNIGTGAFKNSPSLTDVIQEVVDDNGGTGDALAIIMECFGDYDFYFFTYDYSDHSYAPKIHIEYTVAAASHKDISTRFKLFAQNYTDIATRFKLTVALAYKDIATRFKLEVRNFTDIATRFKLTVQNYTDIPTRFKLWVQQFTDIPTRFKLEVQNFIDIATRFRIMLQPFVDIATRFKLEVQSFVDIATRFKLIAQSFTDIATRFKLGVQNFTDIPTRFKLEVQGFTDIATRFILLVRSYVDIATRYQVVVGRYANVSTLFKLRVAGAFPVIGGRHIINVVGD